MLTKEAMTEGCNRLLIDPVLGQVLDGMRHRVVEAMLDADASNVSEIMRLQSIANAISELKAEFQSHVDRELPQEGPNVA